MKLTLILSIPALALLASCNSAGNKPPAEADIPKTITLKSDSQNPANQLEATLKTVPPGIRPLPGYRIVIKGDFDGDGKPETLTEHYMSTLDHQETNKYYTDLPEYDQLVALTIKKRPYAFVSADKSSIDTLKVSSEPQMLGLSYLKNEGDLDGDGADEVSYVVNWADYSSLNTWHIMTYKNKHWKELYSFSIWDWQLPDLPEEANGAPTAPGDTFNMKLEEQLEAFPGLVKKIKTSSIRVIYRNEEASPDTMVVDLKKMK